MHEPVSRAEIANQTVEEKEEKDSPHRGNPRQGSPGSTCWLETGVKLGGGALTSKLSLRQHGTQPQRLP